MQNTTTEMRLPYSAQFICARLCPEQASVALFLDDTFGATVLARQLAQAAAMPVGTVIEEHTEPWDTLQIDAPRLGGHMLWGSGRREYEYGRGVRISLLPTHASRPFVPRNAAEEAQAAQWRHDGILRPDDTPIAAFTEGRLTLPTSQGIFRADGEASRRAWILRRCVDTRLCVRVASDDWLEIFGTAFALRTLQKHIWPNLGENSLSWDLSTSYLELPPTGPGVRQAMRLEVTVASPRPGAPVPMSPFELMTEHHRRSMVWEAPGARTRPVILGLIDRGAGRIRLFVETWRGASRLTRLLTRGENQPDGGAVSEALWTGDSHDEDIGARLAPRADSGDWGVRLRFRRRDAGLPDAEMSTEGEIEISAPRNMLASVRKDLTTRYGTTCTVCYELGSDEALTTVDGGAKPRWLDVTLYA
jgi:hypothetical protein